MKIDIDLSEKEVKRIIINHFRNKYKECFTEDEISIEKLSSGEIYFKINFDNSKFYIS